MPYADSHYAKSWEMQAKGMDRPPATPVDHTPGPWTIGHSDWLISRETSMGYRNFPVRAPEGFDVAMVYYDEDDYEQAANLHLIAAAPEMLAVCKALASDLSLFRFTDGEYRLSEQSVNVMLQSLRQVIALATGGERNG